MKKLNLGCGAGNPKQFQDWINIDIVQRKERSNFIKHDVSKPFTMFENSTIDIVFTEHMFEHINMDQAARCANEMFRILKPEGIFRIAVPDAIFRKDEPCEKFPCGHQHITAWTYNSLKWLLENAGFKVRFVHYWNEFGNEFTNIDLINDDLGYIKRKNSLILDGIK